MSVSNINKGGSQFWALFVTFGYNDCQCTSWIYADLTAVDRMSTQRESECRSDKKNIVLYSDYHRHY